MKTIGGYENRDGMEQYNRDTMVKVIDDKHFFTKNLINVNSSASKAGKKVIYKKDHTALLKQIISMCGDYTRAADFKPTKSTDVSDTKYEQILWRLTKFVQNGFQNHLEGTILVICGLAQAINRVIEKCVKCH